MLGSPYGQKDIRIYPDGAFSKVDRVIKGYSKRVSYVIGIN